MDFDRSKAFSAINADEVRIGSIGYGADTCEELDFYVTHDSKKKVELLSINDKDRIRRFTTRNRDGEKANYPLFYLLEESTKEITPEYRPYVSIDEFLDDYYQRFNKIRTSIDYPIIWLKDVNIGVSRMITEYSPVDNTVRTGDYWSAMQELLEDFTYLDGSKCGIKEK